MLYSFSVSWRTIRKRHHKVTQLQYLQKRRCRSEHWHAIYNPRGIDARNQTVRYKKKLFILFITLQCCHNQRKCDELNLNTFFRCLLLSAPNTEQCRTTARENSKPTLIASIVLYNLLYNVWVYKIKELSRSSECSIIANKNHNIFYIIFFKNNNLKIKIYF